MTYPCRTTQSIQYIVTSIDCARSGNNHDELTDGILGLSVGELGCWIDSAVTRIVQVGVEHTLTPDFNPPKGDYSGI